MFRTVALAVSVALLGGCTTVMSTAQQPKDGPRARLRLAGWSDQMQVDVRQPDGRKGTLYTRSGFYPGDIGNLGMPVGPSGKKGRNEYYVVGDQDVTVRVGVDLVVQKTPTYDMQSICSVSGTFHVEAGKDYETIPVVITKPGSNKILFCAIRATELVPQPDGSVTFKDLRVTPLLKH